MKRGVKKFVRVVLILTLKNHLMTLPAKFASLSLLLLTGLMASHAKAQTIRGVISDAESGEPLPSATVLLEGSLRGTISNLEGEFSIEITPENLPAALLIRYIGYESKRLEIETVPRNPVNVLLNRSVTMMEDIVVTDEDPGISIMERVIERKKIWRADLASYEVDAFTRQVLKNDTSIVSITESGTRSFWSRERGHREVQLFRRQTTNIGEDQNLAGVRFLPNFYDDNITIAGYEMVGVTHPDAMSYYRFRLANTLQIDGDPVYEIEVIPARRLQPLFEGTVYVLGTRYALLEVNLLPNDVVTFPPPVQEFELSYRQQYSNFNQNFWLPVDVRIEGTLTIGFVGLRFPSINFSQTSRLSEYKVNADLPDSLYQKDELLTRALTDSSDGIERKFVPLTKEEKIAYETIDSTNTLEKAFEPEGFLSGIVTDDEDESSFDTLEWLPAGLGPNLQFNRVEGFKTGLKYERYFSEAEFSGSVFTNYSFRAEFLSYGTEVRQRLSGTQGDSGVSIFGRYSNKVQNRFESSIYTEFMNSLQAVAGGRDYFDYYRTESKQAGFTVHGIFSDIDIEIRFNDQNDRSLAVQTEEIYDYSIFGWHRARLPNRDIRTGRTRSIKIGIGVNRQDNDFGISGKRQLALSMEHSGKALASDFNFTNFSIKADWNMETFFRRRVFSNTLDFHVSAGYLFGDQLPQKYGIIDGTLSGLSPFSVLKTRNNRPYEGGQFWLAAAEHNFRTVPFEWLGLTPLADRGIGIILFGGAGYSDAEKNAAGFNPSVTDGIHGELGISINSIFSILRLDFAKRIDSHGQYIGISVPRYF